MLRYYSRIHFMAPTIRSLGLRWFGISGRFSKSGSANIPTDRDSYLKSLEMKEDDFDSMVRHSKFVGIGKAGKKKAIGYIKHVVGDDIYVDFGGKFYGVAKRPANANDA